MPNILLSNNAGSNFTIHKIWQHNSGMLVHGMVELYNKDPTSLSRILEIATQDLKALTPILDAKPFSFMIDLASLASRREFLNLEKWLLDKLHEHGNSFAKACTLYVKEKFARNPKMEQNQRLFDTLFIFFTALQANMNTLSPDLLEELKIMTGRFQSYQKPKFHTDEPSTPAIAATTVPTAPSPAPVAQPPVVDPPAPAPEKPAPPTVTPVAPTPMPMQFKPAPAPQPQPSTTGPAPAPPAPTPTPTPSGNPGENRVFPPEVEESANAYFQKIYTSQISIEEIVGLLTKFKNSKDKR